MRSIRRKGLAPPALFAGLDCLGFGPSLLDPDRALEMRQVRGRHPSILKARMRADCPRSPGVYGMVDRDGDLIYVGKAKCLRDRLASYFRPRSRDPKAGRILQHTRAILWEIAPSEFAALLRELELIRRWRPRFNVRGLPGRRGRAFICLGHRPAPYLYLAARPPAGVLAAFGPVPAGRRTREALRCANDWFQLRDCPRSQVMVFADQAELFPADQAAGCIRYEIGTCLGPCAAACSRSAYLAQARAARAFLEGRDPKPLETTTRQMTDAAACLAFERAATLRDRLASLRWLYDQLALLRQAREQAPCVYPVAGPGQEGTWYLIRYGRVVAAIAAPRDAASRRSAGAATRRVFHGPFGDVGPGEDVESLILVSAWFRRYPGERSALLEPGEALQMCRVRGSALA